MTVHSTKTRNLRLTPLCTCLALTLAGGACSDALAETRPIAAQQAPSHNNRYPNGPRESAQAQRRAQQLLRHQTQLVRQPPPGYLAVTSVVGNCLDDGGPTTLRSLLSAANSGDTIDLSALTCSTITLGTGGVLSIDVDDLTLLGPTTHTLSIDAHGASAVLVDNNSAAGTLTVNNLSIVNGKYTHVNSLVTGVGISTYGNLSMTNSHVVNCRGYGDHVYGAGISANGKVTLTNSTISNNLAKATYTAPPASIGAQTPEGNQVVVVAEGGGVYAGNGISISNSTISGNAAVANIGNNTGAIAFALGGGIYSTSATNAPKVPGVNGFTPVISTITGSTISSNTDYTYANGIAGGGGLYIRNNSLTILNSTIANNSAEKYDGAIAAGQSAATAIYNSTISGNSARQVGGVYLNANYNFTLHGTIIANNIASDTSNNAADLAQSPSKTIPALDAANNVVTSHDAVIALPAATITADPLLQPLGNNGGTTLTQALGAGSPAINHGDNVTGATTDQRGSGFARVVGATADVGAFEVQAAVIIAPVQPVPTLSLWMLAALAAMLGFVGWHQQPRPVQAKK